jgi:heat shock protein HspQ
MRQGEAKFHVGQVVTHLKFGYRGVVFDVDPAYAGSEEWYATMARSRPPKNRPWYHVLVDGATHTTYVAERHLAPDESGRPVAHPLVSSLFSGFVDGSYTPQTPRN